MDDAPPNLTSRAEPSASTLNTETATATHLTFSQALQTVEEPDVSAPRCPSQCSRLTRGGRR